MNKPNDSADDEFTRLRDLNRSHWEEVSRIHPHSSFYQVESIAAGELSISAIERSELGDLGGKSGIHLQCGIGLDTVSLSRLGAEMVGIDFAVNAVQFARSLAQRSRVRARFEVGDVLDPRSLPQASFDFVYTSHGVLRWLASVERWAKNVAQLIRPGGFFYIFEIHPLVYRLDHADGSKAQLSGDYFDRLPKTKQRDQTHCGPLAGVTCNTFAHVDWTISDVINSLIRHGLTIMSYNEHAGTSYMRKGLLPRLHDHLWYPNAPVFPIPVAFSIKAQRLDQRSNF